MEKLIAIQCLIILTFAACTKPVNIKEKASERIIELGVKNVYKYLEILDSLESITPKIIEYKIVDTNNSYFIGDMFVSGPYVKGNPAPRYYQKIPFLDKDVHLLIYYDFLKNSTKDSIEVMDKLQFEEVIVENILDWTLYNEWATNDFERFKFVFCKDDIDNYTINRRLADIEDNLKLPHCLHTPMSEE